MSECLAETVDKRNRIAAHLRQQIVSSHYAPGARLPTRRELECSYDVSTTTIQSALDELQRDGFVDPQGRRGTFVSKRPPHLHRYALAFPCSLGHPFMWNRFWQALVNEASSGEFKSQFQIYYSMDEGEDDNPHRLELTRDAVNQRLAGVIFARPPFFSSDSPLLSSKAIPRVMLSSSTDGSIPTVYPDHHSFIDQALDFLGGRGRRRIAVFMAENTYDVYTDYLREALVKRAIDVPDYWILRVALHPPASARDIVRLLMSGTPRPDGLLITDDNLTEGVCSGLAASGLSVPGDIEVVTEHNFPLPITTPLRVHRLGFDARHILHQCMENIDKQRRGESPPDITLVPASFEQRVQVVVGTN